MERVGELISVGTGKMQWKEVNKVTKYPVSTQLGTALESLFGDVSVGIGYLGRGLDSIPASEKAQSLNRDLNATERACLLREKLEGYVVQMAAEAAELGEDEVPRLRSESAATLVVLRELQTYFPEAFTIHNG